ncbi:Ribosome-associated protein Y (PSrp-1) [Methylacidimicrobium sp. AP8]|uniref:ribosome hibernation-promoting factor, HPF/YfiA family n=1 Tax=Methylacidimicrobium sp. AP8 TaxID=2730359 RepID=UPI0018C1B20F|nr:ribosome-associated translation inhibitor RaiA [Methylacidimicrobium sp. AP8]CAB4244409.1 Ribosome-associated protein Y (PSrp-1) [Methylacidimicrobium sp. AP8]
MQIQWNPQGIKLTPAFCSYVDKKLQKLERHEDRIVAAHVNVQHDPPKATLNKQAFIVKVHLSLPGRDLHAEDRGHDLYQAIDLIVDRLEAQLRRRKTELTEKARHDSREAKREVHAPPPPE